MEGTKMAKGICVKCGKETNDLRNGHCKECRSQYY